MDDRKKLLTACCGPGTRYQVLLSYSDALSGLEDWMYGNWECDVRVRRAKTLKRVVLETTDVVFASRMVLRFSGCKVHIAGPVVGRVDNAPYGTEGKRMGEDGRGWERMREEERGGERRIEV